MKPPEIKNVQCRYLVIMLKKDRKMKSSNDTIFDEVSKNLLYLYYYIRGL